MSKTKERKFWIIMLVAIFSLLFFGCDEKTPVDDIYFNLGPNQSQMVLLVGQSVEMNGYVGFYPSYADNQKYSLTSLDESVLKVSGTKLLAIKEGSATIIVTSDENSKKQDVMTVSVVKDKIKLATPLNFKYNPTLKAFTFDSVTNAASYSVLINGKKYDIGNSNSFALSQCEDGGFDKLITAQVKANAPSYSFALEDSNYTIQNKDTTIYQNSAVVSTVEGGYLHFNKTSAIDYNVYINDELFTQTSNNSISLLQLDENYAGSTIRVSVESLVSDEVKALYGSDVSYLNAISEDVEVVVSDVVQPEINSTIINWNKSAGVSGYKVYVDSNKVIETQNNYFDLASLSGWVDGYADGPYEVLVKPFVHNNVANVGLSVKENKIKFQKLATPTTALTETGITWSGDAKTIAYNVRFVYPGMEQELINIASNGFDLSIFPSGMTYGFQIQASASGLIDGVYYMSSNFAEKQVLKKAEITPEINNYKLEFAATNGEYYQVIFATETGEVNETIKATADSISKSLETYNFASGNNTIQIISKGDGTNSINSNVKTIPFIQFGKAQSIKVENEVLNVIKGSTNQAATVEITTTGANGYDHTTNETTLAFNTTVEGQNKLGVGEYVVSVSILGTGSGTVDEPATFSCKEVETLYLKVLNAPTNSFQDNSKEEITFENADESSNFAIYQVDDSGADVFKANSTNGKYAFALNSGSITFKTQAVGEGKANVGETAELSSALSDPITITRLATPTLTFNNTNNTFTKNVDNYIFKFNNVESDYDFASSFNDLQVGENRFALIEKAVAGTKNLDSKPATLTVTKIDESCTIYVNEQNKLIIAPNNQSEEYSLEVTFTFGGGNVKFVSQEGYLVREGYASLPYIYNNGNYEITLLNDQFNALITAMENNFSCVVRFIKPSTGEDAVANSDVSQEANNLKIKKLEILNSITVSTDNELIISTSDTTEHALRLWINGERKTLDYSFSAGTYKIQLLNENFTPIIAEFATDFSVAVQFSRAEGEGSTSVDSVISQAQSVSILDKVAIGRSGQNLQFTTVANAHNLTDYLVVINDGEIAHQNLASLHATMNANTIQIPMLEILNYANAQGIVGSNVKVAIATLNNATGGVDGLLLSVVSGFVRIERQETVVLSSTKNNNAENNSVVVSFNALETEYSKKYKVEVYNESKSNLKSKDFYDVNEQTGVISFNLDDYTLTGTIYVSAHVETTGHYTSRDGIVYVFNSRDAEELTFEKVDAPTEVSISDTTITFNSVKNAYGYEIYSKVNTVYTKLHNGIITTNSYTFENVEGSNDVVIKTISVASNNGGFTNSNYSDTIVINKLATLSVSYFGGEFIIGLSDDAVALIDNESVNVALEIVTATRTIDIDLKNLTGSMTLSAKTLLAEAQEILSYNTATLEGENIYLTLKVNYVEGVVEKPVHYLNSNTLEQTVYGLFESTKVEQNTTETNDKVIIEHLTWTPSEKNVLNGEAIEDIKYVFKITHNGETYYSTDYKSLMYYDGETLKYYNESVFLPTLISTSSCAFPAGVDKNADGVLNVEDGDVVFGPGTYTVAVKANPTITVSGYNVCSSKYSVEHTFTVLETPDPNVENGQVVWLAQEKAMNYQIEIKKGETIINDTTTNTYYDLANNPALDSIDGFCEVTVRAYNNKKDIVKGEKSAPLLVFRSPKISNAKIDDGNLIITATRLFSTAEISFIDEDGSVQTIPFDHVEESQTVLGGLKNASGELLTVWADYDTADMTALITEKNYIIKAPISTLDLKNGRNYKINVKLIGNTSETLGIVNSAVSTDVNKILAGKLKPNVNEVEYGVIQYDIDDTYKTSGWLNLNYNFNNEDEANVDELWKNLAIYKIEINFSGSINVIYAVDYYSLQDAISAGLCDAGDYKILDDADFGYGGNLYGYVKFPYGLGKYIYLNVFAETRTEIVDGQEQVNTYGNIINLRDFDRLYYYSISVQEISGELSFAMSELDNGYENGLTYLNLAEGGTFAVNISLLGGDQYFVDPNNVGYLTSNKTDFKTFKRYGDNVFTMNAGLVQMEDLSSEIDTPVYYVEVREPNTDLTLPALKNIFVYYDDVNNENDGYDNAVKVVQRNKLDGLNDMIYTELTGIAIGENKYITFDLSQFVDAGIYNLKVKTLAGVGDNQTDAVHYLVNSKMTMSPAKYFRLSNTQFSINSSGKLELPLSYISGDNNQKTYFDTYEITVDQLTVGGEIAQTYVYTINKFSEGVEFVEYVDQGETKQKYIYTLPTKVTLKEGIFNVLENVNYQIKVRALAQATASVPLILNSTYDEKQAFSRSLGVTNVEVDEGVLKWVLNGEENYSKTFIKLVYQDDHGQDVVLTKEVVGTAVYADNGTYLYHYRALDDEFNLTSTAKEEIKSETPYTLSLYIVRNAQANTLHSNFTTPIPINRISQVSSETIIGQDGVLNWVPSANAVAYEVTISASGETYTFITDEAKLDVSTAVSEAGNKLPAATCYAVTVKALGDGDLTAKVSSVVLNFIKPQVVENIRIESGKIAWDEVENAQGYAIKFYYGFTETEWKTVGTEVLTFEAPADITGTFKVEIKAIGVGESKVLTSDVSEFASSTNKPIQVGEITFDEQTNSYVWNVANDFSSGDKLIVRYDFEDHNPDKTVASSGSKEVVIDYEKGRTTYNYQLTAIGNYTSFAVQVFRNGTLYSNPVMGPNHNFNLFAYGNGLESDGKVVDGVRHVKYRIDNYAHLLNIKYFPSAHYVLTQSINLSEKTLDFSAGYLIAPEFSGTIDGQDPETGNNLNIHGFNLVQEDRKDVDLIQLTNKSEFALFKNLNNAKISNLDIGSEDYPIILRNSFANSIENSVKLSLIATGANNSTLENVKVRDFTIELTSQNSSQIKAKEIQLSALIAQSYDTKLTDVEVNFNVKISVGYTSTVYVGGLIAKSGLAETSTTIEIVGSHATIGEITSSGIVAYFGGLVGYHQGTSNEDCSISSSTATITVANLQANYVGGIVGLGNNLSITGCSTTGSVTYTSLASGLTLGGIVGSSSNAIIEGSKTTIIFDMTIVNTSNKQLGAIAGKLSGNSSLTYSSKEGYVGKTDVSKTGKITLGAYGHADSGVEVADTNANN